MKSATESGEQNASSHGVTSSGIGGDEIRAALEKICASPGFANADRICRFLRYAVDASLDHENDKLKETLIGIEVFGRKPTYDPRIDAVVRTEAVKLRARLKSYYETEGLEDPVVIEMPKGAYVPAFRRREEPVEAPLPSAGTADSSGVIDSKRGLIKTGAAALLVVLILGGSVWFATHKGGRTGELSSIAVLPFEDLSPQHDQEYFCDGMTEEIIDALTRVGGFRVVARTSSFSFKGKQQDIREIGRKLNVGAVLEGSVRKYGNKLRVTAQLNSVDDGYHLWSETYERELKDVFSLQDEISQSIVDTLQVKLVGKHGAGRAKTPENLESYDLYLRGRYHWGRWRTEGAEKAQHYFEQAIAEDPNFALAYAGLADSYCWLGFFSALPPNQAMPKAKEAALKAIQLDDSLADAHKSLAYVRALYDFDWPGAEKEFKRAIQLNPGLADAHFGYGIVYLAPLGRIQDAVREMKLARSLDPLSLATNTYLGFALQLDGKLDQAVEYYRKALELDPNFDEAHYHLSGVYVSRGMLKEASDELKGMRGPACRGELSQARIDALQGKRKEALEVLRRWEHPDDGLYVRPTSMAMVTAALGDGDATMSWLGKAYADRDGILAYAGRDPAFGKYRSDPRFQELMRKVGLAQ